MPTKTSETPPPPAAPAHPSNRFFDWVRALGINREPGWIGGVSAGVATRLGIDPIIVRGIVVVVAVLGGPALLLYAAAWLLLPDLQNRIHLERLIKGEFDTAVVGVGVLFLVSLLPFSHGFWFTGPWSWSWNSGGLGSTLWTIVVIAAIVGFVIWLVRRSHGSSTPLSSATTDAGSDTIPDPASTAGPTPPPPALPTAPPADSAEFAAWKEQQAAWKQEHAAWKAEQAESARAIALQQRRIRQEESARRRQEWVDENRRTRSNPLFSLVAIGISLVAGAAVALIVGGGSWTLEAAITGMAVALGVLGLAVVTNGFMGRRSGGSSGMAVIVAIALVFTSIFTWANGPVVSNGPLDWTPNYSSGQTAQRTVLHGDVTLDLSDYYTGSSASSFADDRAGRVNVYVFDGSVDVIAPADAQTNVQANTASGSVDTSNDPADDGSNGYTFEPTDSSTPARPHLVVRVWIVSGDITLSQAHVKEAAE